MAKLLSPFILLAVIALSGCATTGVFNAANLTNVELADDNFHVVATNVQGEASARYLIGISGAVGMEMRTLALFPLSDDRLLYQQALQNLWENFAAENGPAVGRSLALVNVRYDSHALNLIVYTRPTVSIRADVVEFVQ